LPYLTDAAREDFQREKKSSISLYIKLDSKSPQETSKVSVSTPPPLLNIRTKVGTPNKARELPDLSKKRK
jgi:hypothetical protein